MLFPKLYKYSDSAGLILLKFIFQAVARLLSAYFCNAAEIAVFRVEKGRFVKNMKYIHNFALRQARRDRAEKFYETLQKSVENFRQDA